MGIEAPDSHSFFYRLQKTQFQELKALTLLYLTPYFVGLPKADKLFSKNFEETVTFKRLRGPIIEAVRALSVITTEKWLEYQSEARFS